MGPRSPLGRERRRPGLDGPAGCVVEGPHVVVAAASQVAALGEAEAWNSRAFHSHEAMENGDWQAEWVAPWADLPKAKACLHLRTLSSRGETAESGNQR